MFNLRVVAQQGSKFDAMIYKKRENVGGIGKDDEGIYINLNRRLSIQETIDLLKLANGLSQDFYQLDVEIKYVRTTVE